MTHEILDIPLEKLRTDGETQSRVALNEATVAEYAEAIRLSVVMPPVVAFFDGVEFWLADGFHRYFAHKSAGAIEIQAEVREGTKRDAILFSVGANATHGLRRSDADKRRAIMFLLADEEWGIWSDREIARRCCVAPTTVSRVRADVAAFYKGETRDEGGKYRPGRDVVFDSHHLLKIPTVHVDSDERAYTTKHGTAATINTANIGKAKPAAPEVVSQPAPSPEVLEPVELVGDHVQELQDSLKETLADNEMMGRVFDADDRLKAAIDEAKRQKAIADNAERKFNAQQGKVQALAEQVTYWKGRAEKAERALKVAA